MKTVNARLHRQRHRGRHEVIAGTLAKHARKLGAFLSEAATQMNAIVGVAGVTNDEVLSGIENNATLNPVGVRDIRAPFCLGTTAVAEVEALGIPIA